MILKTHATCLRITPFSRTSHIAAWSTPDAGLLRTVVKGAVRPRSMFLGQYDLFYDCEILYYARERDGLHILKECTPLDTRRRFRTDWRGAALASYACDLRFRLALTGHDLHRLHAALRALLDDAAARGARLAAWLRFELAVLRLLGLTPSLEQCTVCGRKLGAQPVYIFSVPQGGIVCPDCPVRGPAPPARLMPAQLHTLRDPQRSAARENQRVLLALLGEFLAYHLDLATAARRLAAAAVVEQGVRDR